jgi:small GTP-binding protein
MNTRKKNKKKSQQELKDSFVKKEWNIERDHNDYFIKIILLGDSGVGKTTLIKRFKENTDLDDSRTEPTMGVDFAMKYLYCKEYGHIKVQVWDTAGQERFRSYTRSYLRGAQGMIFVCDVTGQDALQSISKWSSEVDTYRPDSDKYKKIVVANKTDLTNDIKINFQDLASYCKEKGLNCMRCSATKDSIDRIDYAFFLLINSILSDKTLREECEDRLKVDHMNNGLHVSNNTNNEDECSC